MPRLMAFGIVGLAGCASPASTPIFRATQLDYALAVEWLGAQRTTDGWGFVNARGYEIVVDSWQLGTVYVELVPCPSPGASSTSDVEATPVHGAYTHDPSVLEGPWLEELVSGETLSVGRVAVDAEDYCEGFHVHAVADGAMASETSGRFRAPGADEWTRFEAWTPLSSSGLTELEGGRLDDSLEVGEVRVIWTRHPVLAFSEVDFEALTESELGFVLASELARTSTANWFIAPGP